MEKPDIIFIICHDLGKRLSIYNQSKAKTPALCRMAEEGITFDNFFSTSNLCSPSRGSIATGRYPHQIGLFGLTNMGWDMNDDEFCVPKIFNEAGYETVLFGGQHETQNVSKLGYKTVVPLPGKHPNHVSTTASQVVDYIKSLEEREKRDPVYINYFIFEPHRHNFWDQYTPISQDDVICPGYLPDTADVRTDLARYDGLIEAMDTGVETILNTLDELDMSESTLVIFTTDHGIAFPRAKQTLYNPGIEVTVIARWPENIAEDQRDSSMLSHVDWAPTFLELTNQSVPANICGKSFLPRLLGQKYQDGGEIFAEATYDLEYNPTRCIRTQDFKFILNFNTQPAKPWRDDELPTNGLLGFDDYPESYWQPRPLEELYDLRNDPDEFNNLSENADYADIKTRLKEKLIAWMDETSDPVGTMYHSLKINKPANIPFTELVEFHKTKYAQ